MRSKQGSPSYAGTTHWAQIYDHSIKTIRKNLQKPS